MARIGTEISSRRVIVDMADMKVTNDHFGVYSTYVLGSCVAVAIYDPVARVSGLLHFILPESSINTKKALQNPYIFADTGIPLLFRNAYKLGADKERIICRVAGGSNVLDPNNTFNVGVRNHDTAVQILTKNNVKIAGDYPGGLAGITLTLHMGTGRAVVKLPNGEEMEYD